MNIPDFRKALYGRTFSQRWEPRAVEIHVGYRSPLWHLWNFVNRVFR